MSSQRSKVLKLYRQLLRLHRRLPDADMAALGRQFVREEFRCHKSAGSEFVASFMKEWTVSLQAFRTHSL